MFVAVFTKNVASVLKLISTPGFSKGKLDESQVHHIKRINETYVKALRTIYELRKRLDERAIAWRADADEKEKVIRARDEAIAVLQDELSASREVSLCSQPPDPVSFRFALPGTQ